MSYRLGVDVGGSPIDRYSLSTIAELREKGYIK